LACLYKWSLWLRLFFQIHKLQWISIVILQISLTLQRVQGKVAQWSHTFKKINHGTSFKVTHCQAR
jgi:hypothetical protein